jgi:hypothetical protein
VSVDINLRHGIGEANLCRLFQDMLAFETECITKFRQLVVMIPSGLCQLQHVYPLNR